MLMNNNTDLATHNGYLKMERFKVMNSAGGAIYSKIVAETTNNLMKQLNDTCPIRLSGYQRNYGCNYCVDSVLDRATFNCVRYCPQETKNALTGICLNCVKKDCTEIDKTTFVLEKIDVNKFRFKPTREILGETLKFTKNNLKVKIGDKTESDRDAGFNYEIFEHKGKNYVDIVLDIKKKINDEEIAVEFHKDPARPLFDLNRNLLNDTLRAQMKLDKVCFLEESKKKIMDILAFIILGLFALSVLLLIAVTLFCFSKIRDLGSLWKLCLNNWVKL